MGLTPTRPFVVVAALAMLATACSSGVAPTTASPTAATTTAVVSSKAKPTNNGAVVLLQGTTKVDAAQSFDDAGFHKTLSLTATVPDLGPLAGVTGSTIVVSLRDASRPGQTCNQDHPLSGCLTIDWSDAPGRPRVPDSGVFRNELTFTTGGTTTLHLSESGVLADNPDQFTPG